MAKVNWFKEMKNRQNDLEKMTAKISDDVFEALRRIETSVPKEDARVTEEKELTELKQKVTALENKLNAEKKEEAYASEQGRVYEVAQEGIGKLLEMYSNESISSVKMSDIVFEKTEKEKPCVYFVVTTPSHSFAGKVSREGTLHIWGTGLYENYTNGIKSPSYGFRFLA